jgi:hypothetical protein
MPDTAIPLLFDSISKNTGDMAIGIAARQLFAKRGIETVTPSPFDSELTGPAVVGGGELIRDSGDSFYDAFRRTGPHILSSAGVWTSADDLGYLNDYAFVSARSTREVEVLQRSVAGARVLPCATTLLESDRFQIPGVSGAEPVVGIHLAPHALRMIEDIVDIVDSIPYRKLFLPFTHYNGDRSFMAALPFDTSNAVLLDDLQPLELHSVIGQLKYLVATSLHASIFAYSQNVPFASIYQKKVGFYFSDRGLQDHVVATGDALRDLLERLNGEAFDFSHLIESDRAEVESAFDQFAEIARTSQPAPAAFQYADKLSGQSTANVLAEQATLVLHDRDLAVEMLEARRRSYVQQLAAERARREGSEEELASTRETLQRVSGELAQVAAQLAHIRSRWYVKLMLMVRRAFTRLSGGGTGR